MGKERLRCGTSVGANYRAACRARSRAEFVSRLGIVVEEADESMFGWSCRQILVSCVRTAQRVARRSQRTYGLVYRGTTYNARRQLIWLEQEQSQFTN
jgi:hypothetical protein